MMRMWQSCLVIGLLSPGAAAASDWRSSAGGYNQAIFEQTHDKVPLIVYFRTDWCGFCKALDAEVFANEKVQAYLEGFALVKVNPDSSTANKELAKQFGVTGYPSVFVVRAGEKPVKVSVSGDKGADAFIATVRKAAGDARAASATKPGAAIPKATAAATPAAIAFERPPEILGAIPQEILDLQDAGRHEEAVSRISQELKRSERAGVPGDAGLYYGRALSYRTLHRHSSAAEDLQRWLDVHPGDTHARELLARCYLNVKMYDDAASELKRLADDAPTAEIHFLLAEADVKCGKPEEAKSHYATACTLGYKPACK